MRKQGFLSLLYTARWGSFFTFRDSESAGSGKPNMKSGSEKSPDRFFLSGKEYLRLAEDGQSGGNALRRAKAASARSCLGRRASANPTDPAENMNQQRPTHGFRQRRRPCRRGEGMRRAGILRSVYVRTHDARNNRKIRPEICPNMGAARNFFKFFKKFSFSVQRTGTKYRVYNIRTLLCTSKCSASRAFLRPHTQNSHPIPCKPVNIRKPAHGLKQIRSEMCKTAPDPD